MSAQEQLKNDVAPHELEPPVRAGVADDRASAESVSRAMCRRVLLVEDGRRLREMLIDAIGFMGMAPDGAPTAEAAMEMLDRELYTTAIVDLNLPGMGGLELCEIIRQRWPDVQLIILTAFGNLDAARRAIHLDVVDFLTKPCGMDELEAALSRACLRWIERCPPDERADQIDDLPFETKLKAPPPRAGASMDEIERQTIFAALARCGGNRDAAAAELGISVRKLYYRLQQYQKRGFLPAS